MQTRVAGASSLLGRKITMTATVFFKTFAVRVDYALGKQSGVHKTNAFAKQHRATKPENQSIRDHQERSQTIQHFEITYGSQKSECIYAVVLLKASRIVDGVNSICLAGVQL